MTLTHVTCTTMEFNDNQANSHKMYRTYACGRWAVFQWGRIGTLGQWSAASYPTAGDAKQAVIEQAYAKTSKGGYVHTNTTEFFYDESLISDKKNDLVGLDDARLGAPQPGVLPGVKPHRPTATKPAPTPAVTTPTPADASNPHAVFAGRALAAISLAVTDPQKAAEEFAILNNNWKELEIQHAKAASYLKTLNQMLIGASA